jgi:NADH dehydrogenase
VLASTTSFASRATLGRFPKLLTTSRDQVDLLAQDNVVSEKAEAEARVLRALGIAPQAPDAIIPAYLVRFRKTGQYEVQRSA